MNQDSKRLIIFIVFSFAILFGFNKFFGPKPGDIKEQQPASTAVVSSSSPAAAPAQGQAEAGELPFSLGTAKEIKTADSEGYTVETPLISVTFSNIGGVIQSYKLKKYRSEERRVG